MTIHLRINFKYQVDFTYEYSLGNTILYTQTNSLYDQPPSSRSTWIKKVDYHCIDWYFSNVAKHMIKQQLEDKLKKLLSPPCR